MFWTILTSSVVSSTDFASVISAIQAQISISSIVEILAYAAGICVGFVFLWWGVRKVVRMIMGAVRKGKLNP